MNDSPELKERLDSLRARMSQVNEKIMDQLNEFTTLSKQIGQVKDQMGLPHFDPERESVMLREVESKNQGPMRQDLMNRIFKDLFKASVEDMGAGSRRSLQVSRLPDGATQVVEVKGVQIGGARPIIMAGPCAVENQDQVRITAEGLKKLGVGILRGGAFKPRTSPYSFQGLEEEGLKILRTEADRLGLAVITEVLSVRDVELVERYADIMQVGTRNMSNYSLLKELGRCKTPVMLKRGMAATIDEFILAAEYIHIGGNTSIILCERGIRTFETQTRNTLDISSVPILKMETKLPVIVDVSHSVGRKDIIKPIAKASLAAGADGLMFECHHDAVKALSDSGQQLSLDEAADLIASLKEGTELS